MSDILLTNETLIRLAAFAGILATMAAWEILAPRRDLTLARRTRWAGNIGIVILDTALVRLLFPMTAVGLALAAEAHKWGLLHAPGLPLWVSAVLAFVALDLAV